MAGNRLQIKFTDEDGDSATHSIPVAETVLSPVGGAMDDLADSIAGLTNAGYSRASVVLDKVPGTVVPGTGAYDVQDKMAMSFSTLAGVALRVAVPAPIRALMAANDETWAAGEAAIDTLASAIGAVVVSTGGSVVTGIKRSWRTRRNRRQR